MTSHQPIMITLELRPDIAMHLERMNPVSPEARELTRCAARSGTTIEPIFPGADDPHMASFFSVQVPSQGKAERLLTTLRAQPAVISAYIKPPDELP